MSMGRTLNDRVTRNIEDLRVLRRMQVAELAGALGFSQATYYRRKKDGAEWRLHELEVVASTLDVDVTRLFAEDLLPPLLPHLDSNQKPAGSHSGGGPLRVVTGGSAA